MGRSGGAVIAMEVVALVVAYLAFDWPALLVGAPLLVGTALVLLVVRVAERSRPAPAVPPAAPWDPTATVPGGLMSGFFEIPAQAAAPRTTTPRASG